jgi:hypothetical protein
MLSLQMIELALERHPAAGLISVPSDENRTIAWVVAWQNDRKPVDAVTAW